MSMRAVLRVLITFIALILSPTLAPVIGRVGPALASQNRVPGIQPVGNAKYLVLFVLDGARPDYFGVTKLPHLDALRAGGTQFSNAIDGILESETPAGHTALTTGSTPRRNGILGFNWAQNDHDYSLFSPDVIRSGAMEHIMVASRAPTIAGLYKDAFPHARVVALSGHKYYAADPLGGPRADAIMYFQGDQQGRYLPVAVPGHLPPPQVLTARGLIRKKTQLPDGVDDMLASKLALAAFSVMHQRITLINVPEFDWPLGHVYGGQQNRAKLIALMSSFDRDLGRIENRFRKAGILDKTLFVITSDHGMGQITHFVSSDVILKAVAAAGTKTVSISYNHSAYVWIKDPNKAAAVARSMVATHERGLSNIYYLDPQGHRYLRAAGTSVSPQVEAAQQYLLNTLMNGHQPTMVIFCRTDSTFSSSATHWRADHGGATWQSQHIPLIISGPGIRPGIISGQPARLIDIAPTVLSDMGVQPTGMEGHVLTEALVQSSARARATRAADVQQLMPIVNALTAQDTWETAHPVQK